MENETQFLAEEAERARAAIRATLLEMKRTAGEVADPRTWIRQYPWTAAGSSAVLGFLAAWKVTPARRETMGEKWDELAGEIRSLKDRLMPGSGSAAEEDRTDGVERKRKSKLLGFLLPLSNLLLRTFLKTSNLGAGTPAGHDPRGF